MIGKIGDFFRREGFLLGLIGLFLLLYFSLRPPFEEVIKGVDWRSLGGLGLILLFTQGLKESGFFETLERGILKLFSTPRGMGLALVGTTFLLSPLLTNDITLIIIVPLTLQLEKVFGKSVVPLIFLEAFSANLGSGVSPIGNPQNLYLYLQSGLHFWEFLKIMVPAMGVPMVGILLLTALLLEGKGENRERKGEKEKAPSLTYSSFKQFFFFSQGVRWRLALGSLLGIVGVIVGMEAKMEWIIWVGVPFYLWKFPQLAFKIDWGILGIFLFIFLDCALILKFPLLPHLFAFFPSTSTGLYFQTLLLSQFISNFPATILLSHFSTSPIPLLYGADLGGNGSLISSLANIIALRYLNRRGVFLKFHLYSLPLLGSSALWGWWLLQIWV
ncbi:MAG: hypothetical protein C6I01_00955 [Epsilonproteobacteria bacterium]|nr:hypothetical protein [Campylobacterota bacterium]NPA89367.1 hypothetical protein [Campylobacterota bacterium]